MNVLGITYAALAALCWAIAPILLKKGLTGMSRVQMLTARTVTFAGSVTLFSCMEGVPLNGPPSFELLFLIGTVVLSGNVLGDLAYFRAIQQIGASRAVAIACSYPIFVILGSTVWLGEPMTPSVVLGTVLIVGGLILLRGGIWTPRKGARDQDRDGSQTDGDHHPAEHRSAEERAAMRSGFFFAILTAFSWGCALLLQKWLISERHIAPVTVTLWRSYFLFVLCWSSWVTMELRSGRNPLAIFRLGWKPWFLASVAGGAGLGAGGYFFAKGLQLIPVSVGTPISATSPLITALIGVVFLKETVTILQWIGICVVSVGVLVVSL